MVVFYVLAGLNHFIMPDFYYGLIPEYLLFPKMINGLAGIVEITLGLALTFPSLRKSASWGIILMLIAFIPSHIYFIKIGSCVGQGLCVPPWVAWVRLLVIHPLLIFWAFIVSRMKYN
jgi:uncharacterized membrane protein